MEKRMKKLILFFVFLLSASIPVHANQKPLPANLKNESGISYNLEAILGELGRSICKGGFPNDVNYAPLAYEKQNFEKGIDCVVGDFDGNGYTDFALNGRTSKIILVLFFEKNKLIRNELIKSKLTSPASYYAASSKMGPCGESASSLPGLFQMATDRYNMWTAAEGQIYFYNPATQKMQAKSFGKPPLKTCK